MQVGVDQQVRAEMDSCNLFYMCYCLDFSILKSIELSRTSSLCERFVCPSVGRELQLFGIRTGSHAELPFNFAIELNLAFTLKNLMSVEVSDVRYCCFLQTWGKSDQLFPASILHIGQSVQKETDLTVIKC